MSEPNAIARNSRSLPILPAGETDEVDPVCGMKVSPTRAAATVEYVGHKYLFCSKGCAERFQQDPARYLGADGGSVGHEHAEVGHERAERSEQPRGQAIYTCPMHPQIVRDGPGSCPICGMALEPRRVSAEEEANPELVAMTRRFWVSVAL